MSTTTPAPPAPTAEQADILDGLLERGHSTVVSAAPGAGKTTLLLFLAARLRLRHRLGHDEPRILWLTYNRHLRLDTLERLKHVGLEGAVDCHTYHSFCTAAFHPAPTDAGIAEVLRDGLPPREYTELSGHFGWDVVGLDEAQDLSPLLVDFVRHAMTFCAQSAPPRILVLGDSHQCVFQWRGATDVALRSGAELFPAHGPWRNATMLTSFRLHPGITRFLTDMCLPPAPSTTEEAWIRARPGLPRSPAVPPTGKPPENQKKRKKAGAHQTLSAALGSPARRVLYVAGGGVARTLAAVVHAIMADPAMGDHQPDRLFILAPSVRPNPHNPTTAVLVELENQLARLGYPIYNPETDDDGRADLESTRGKIAICTYGQSKGRERDIAVVLGFDAAGFYRGCERECVDGERMPSRLFVACTRARQYLVLVDGSVPSPTSDFGGPLPFLRLGDPFKRLNQAGYAAVASHPCAALLLSRQGSSVWTVYHESTQPPPEPSGLAIAEARGRCLAALALRRHCQEQRYSPGAPAAVAEEPSQAAKTAKTAKWVPERATRYMSAAREEAVHAYVVEHADVLGRLEVVQYGADGADGVLGQAFPDRVCVTDRRGARPGAAPVTHYVAVSDIGHAVVRTVWEMLVRPGDRPHIVGVLVDEVPVGWAQDRLCEAQPGLAERLRTDWLGVFGAWAKKRPLRVPETAGELAGVVMAATQYLCWRDRYITRWFALAPFAALAHDARRRVQVQLDTIHRRSPPPVPPVPPVRPRVRTRPPNQAVGAGANAAVGARRRKKGAAVAGVVVSREFFAADGDPCEAFAWLPVAVLGRCLLVMHQSLGVDSRTARLALGQPYVLRVAGPGPTRDEVEVQTCAEVVVGGAGGEEGWVFRGRGGASFPTATEVETVCLGLASGLARVSALDFASGQCLRWTRPVPPIAPTPPREALRGLVEAVSGPQEGAQNRVLREDDHYAHQVPDLVAGPE
jgi:hypothetical protein